MNVVFEVNDRLLKRIDSSLDGLEKVSYTVEYTSSALIGMTLEKQVQQMFDVLINFCQCENNPYAMN